MNRKAVLAALGLPLIPRMIGAQTGAAPHKIGLTIPLTGPFATVSVEYLAAYQVAIANLNQHGGIDGRLVELLVEDSQASPEGGIAAMRKLVQVDGVEAILTFLGNVVTAEIPLADQLRMPTLAVLESPGIVDKANFVFANGVRVAKAELLMRDYWKQHGKKRIYAFLSNNATGQAMATTLPGRAREAGADIVLAFVNIGDTDFRGELARAKDYKPDALYINTAGSAADAIIIRQARDLGLNQQFFSAANFYTVHAWREAVGLYAEGIIFGGARVDPQAGRNFIRAYRTKMGFEPGYAQGELYDTVTLIAYAIAHGGGSGDGIRDALANLKGVPSVLGGTIAMGADHYTVIPSIALWQVRHGVELRVA